MADRRITLGAFIINAGVHATGWRLPKAAASAPGFAVDRRVAQRLEAGC